MLAIVGAGEGEDFEARAGSEGRFEISQKVRYV
jgi:hypothetical protein